MTSYPVEQLLEIAFAAYRVNKGYVKQTSRFTEGKPTVWSNKELISYTAAETLRDKTSVPSWIPDDFKPIEVTDEDRAGVQEAHRFFRRYTMLILGDSLNQFQKDMFSAYSNTEVVSHNKIGFVAYIPAFIKNEGEEIAYKRRLKEDFSESQHLTTKLVNGQAEILKRIYLKEYGMYLYFAGVGKDLVSFTKQERYDIGAIYSIRAKVKNNDTERDSRLPMTKINYVKLNLIEEE